MHRVWTGIALLALATAATAETHPSVQQEPAAERAEFIATVRLARQGDRAAQWRTGITYARLGESAKALPWLESAARAGHPAAAGLLGAMHEEGRGVPADKTLAIDWYRQAAELGDIPSMAAMARLLPSGDAARNWALRAAEAGNADAQYWLGLRQSEAAASEGEAFRWFVAAAKQGHAGAQLAAATMVLAGKAAGARKEDALGWLRAAADAGDPVAGFELADVMARDGKANPAFIRERLAIAAKAGHREAQFRLGAELAGSKKPSDRNGAIPWLERATSAGHLASANLLGEILLDRVGGEQQAKRARTLFASAAEQGNLDGMYNLARMQQWGLGGERDTSAALRWFARAAEGEHPKAREVLDDLLGRGAGSKPMNMKGFWQ